MVYPPQRERVFKLAKARKQTASQLLDDLIAMATLPADELRRRLDDKPAAAPAREPDNDITVAEEIDDDIVVAEEIDI